MGTDQSNVETLLYPTGSPYSRREPDRGSLDAITVRLNNVLIHDTNPTSRGWHEPRELRQTRDNDR